MEPGTLRQLRNRSRRWVARTNPLYGIQALLHQLGVEQTQLREYAWVAALPPVDFTLVVLAGAPMAATTTPLALGVVVALVGLVLAPLESSAYVLAAELAPQGTLTESGTWMTSAINVSAAAGLATAGTLVDEVGVPATLAVAGCCTAAGLLVALLGRERLGAAPYRGRHTASHATARQLRRERRIL